MGKISVPDPGNPSFLSHLSALGASGEVQPLALQLEEDILMVVVLVFLCTEKSY